MKIVSFLNERPVIQKILKHLNMWGSLANINGHHSHEPDHNCRYGCSNYFPDSPNFDDGSLGYEEPYITCD